MRRRTRGLVAAGVAVVVAAAGAIVWLLQPDDGGNSSVAVPRFVDDTVASGLDHRYEGGAEFFEGGGLASLDCDDNGFADLYLAGGAAPAGLYRNTSDVGGALRFERLASAVTDLTSVTGAYPLDLDNDAVTDLMVLRHAEGNVFLRGLGGCRFEDATADVGIDPGTSWTTAFSATWESGEELPTLAFGNFRNPGELDCATSLLVRPDGGGDRYDNPLPLEPGFCTLSVLFSDWSGTGRRDLRMSNDRNYYRDGSEQLWRVEPGAAPALFTEADGWRPLQIWGMGIASQDLTGDGLPEVFLTSQGDNKLQTLDGDPGRPAYRDLAVERGATATRPYAGGDVLPSTAWHPEFADLNNDGITDLFVTKGNVEGQADYASRDPNNLLLGTVDGTFTEQGEAAGLVRFERGRGATAADLNLDGLLDIVVVNRAAPVTVWRNAGAGDAAAPAALGGWVGIRVTQPAPNTAAIGGWLEVRRADGVTRYELNVGGGHASGDLGWLHVGLGAAAEVDVRVRWPDGSASDWATVRSATFVIIDRATTEPVVWKPN